MTAPLARWSSPAGRLLGGTILVAGVATARPTASALCVGLALGLGIAGAARPPPAALARRALPALGVIAAVLAPLVISGHFDQAAVLAARATLGVGIALSVASTLALDEVPGALRALGLPAALGAVTATMLRQLGAVRDQGRRMVLARALRGARGAGLSAGTLAALLVRTADRASRVELAMQLRGYSLAEAATRSALRVRDAAVVAACTASAVVVHVV